MSSKMFAKVTRNNITSARGILNLSAQIYKTSILGGQTVKNDPHFFIPLPNGENLCYSVQGQPDFMFSLIKDKYIQLNAQFVLPASDESHTIANVSTFLGDLGLLLRCPDTGITTAIQVSARDHSIKVENEHIVVGTKPVMVMISNISVTTAVYAEEQDKLKDESAWLYISSDIGFGMKIRFYKKHLDMMITKSDGLTSEADGLIGKQTTYLFALCSSIYRTIYDENDGNRYRLQNNEDSKPHANSSSEGSSMALLRN